MATWAWLWRLLADLRTGACTGRLERPLFLLLTASLVMHCRAGISLTGGRAATPTLREGFRQLQGCAAGVSSANSKGLLLEGRQAQRQLGSDPCARQAVMQRAHRPQEPDWGFTPTDGGSLLAQEEVCFDDEASLLARVVVPVGRASFHHKTWDHVRSRLYQEPPYSQNSPKRMSIYSKPPSGNTGNNSNAAASKGPQRLPAQVLSSQGGRRPWWDSDASCMPTIFPEDELTSEEACSDVQSMQDAVSLPRPSDQPPHSPKFSRTVESALECPDCKHPWDGLDAVVFDVGCHCVKCSQFKKQLVVLPCHHMLCKDCFQSMGGRVQPAMVSSDEFARKLVTSMQDCPGTQPGAGTYAEVETEERGRRYPAGNERQYLNMIAARANMMREADAASVRAMQLSQRIDKTKARSAAAKARLATGRAQVAQKREAVEVRRGEYAASAAAAASARQQAKDAVAELAVAEQDASRQGNAMARLRTEMKEIVQSGKEANEKLKACIDDINDIKMLLA